MKDEADGSNEYNNFQRGSLNTTKQIIRDLKNIDIVFHIGDICYANGYLSQWDQFTSQIEPIASTVPYMIARYFSSLFPFAQSSLCIVEINCSSFAVVTTNVTGLERDLSMGAWILEENVVCWLRLCFMYLQRTERSSGMSHYVNLMCHVWINM